MITSSTPFGPVGKFLDTQAEIKGWSYELWRRVATRAIINAWI